MVIATMLACVLFWPAFQFAWDKWGTDPNYGHGYFVPVAAGYLAWRKRGILGEQVVKPTAGGLAPVLPAVALHVMAVNAGLLRFSMIAFVAVLAGGLAVFRGWETVRQLAFPLGFLLFAVPIPLYLESATLPMKLLASSMSTGILDVCGLSVYREGTIIHLSNVSLEVATACSGLKSLVLVTAVGAFYAYVSQTGAVRRWIVFLASIPIAIGANVARIVATALLSNFTSGELTRDMIHDFSGLFVFLVAGALFVVTGMAVETLADRPPFTRLRASETVSAADSSHD